MNPTARDAPARLPEMRRIIESKPGLRRWYLEVYATFEACLSRCPPDGLAVELGSGGGFARSVIPALLTTDVQPGPGIDRVVDATAMPFDDGSVRMLCMLNVFHHIPDVAAFLSEARRVLCSGGRVMIVDQFLGLLSRPIYRLLHDEPCDLGAGEWAFDSTGPRSGANGALAHIVFERDRARFEREFPELAIVSHRPHTPLRYWLSGGLKRWTLLPGMCFPLATVLDRALCGISRQTCSFVDIELLRGASA